MLWLDAQAIAFAGIGFAFLLVLWAMPGYRLAVIGWALALLALFAVLTGG